MTDIVGAQDKLDGKATEIAGVRVKDKYTLELKLVGPRPQFLAKLTYTVFFVVNKDAVEKGFDQVDGSGPFKLQDYKRDQYLKLARNDNFYLGAPRLSLVNMALGANAANSTVLYDQGKIDLTDVGASAEVERALDPASPLNKELVVTPQLNLFYLAFNTHARPFDDIKVRQAFSLVVDRPRIARATRLHRTAGPAFLRYWPRPRPDCPIELPQPGQFAPYHALQHRRPAGRSLASNLQGSFWN